MRLAARPPSRRFVVDQCPFEAGAIATCGVLLLVVGWIAERHRARGVLRDIATTRVTHHAAALTYYALVSLLFLALLLAVSLLGLPIPAPTTR